MSGRPGGLLTLIAAGAVLSGCGPGIHNAAGSNASIAPSASPSASALATASVSAVASPVASPPTPVSYYLGCLEPGFTYGGPPHGPPVPRRLATDRLCGGPPDRLEAVSPKVVPRISGADAYAHISAGPSAQPRYAVSEELAYYSAASPGTIPEACVPGSGATPPASGCGGTPWYQHTLVWFFVWKATCPPAMGPWRDGAPPVLSVPATCVWFTVMDATTGVEGGTTSG
jgi:hypothetical protein